MMKIDKKLMEELSSQEHKGWSSWMEHLFSKCVIKNGETTIPFEFVERWKRQIKTNYFDLSEEEKESDRNEVRKFLSIMEPIMESKSYKNIVCEAKDLKKFKAELNSLINKDVKALKLQKLFKNDNQNIVDYVDYLLSKYEKEISKLMKLHNVNYDEFMRSL